MHKFLRVIYLNLFIFFYQDHLIFLLFIFKQITCIHYVLNIVKNEKLTEKFYFLLLTSYMIKLVIV